MAEHNELGKIGEDEAIAYLKSKGYSILYRNWRSGKFELDIIAENDKFYAGYIARNEREIAAYKRDADLKIPHDFQYTGLPGLTNELIEKLTATNFEQTPGYGTDYHCKNAAELKSSMFSSVKIST